MTSLRNIIGTITLKSANCRWSRINLELLKVPSNEILSWVLEVVGTKLAEIDSPEDVQETMNKVVKTENEIIAVIDYATATETTA